MSITSNAAAPSATVDHVFLAGRPPLGEFLGFVTSHSVDRDGENIGDLMAAWGAANDHVVALQELEGGYANDASLGTLPPEVAPLAARAEAAEIVKRSCSALPYQIAMIELDRLVVFQKFINLEHAARLRERIGEGLTPEQLFHFCLPIDERMDPPVAATQVPATNAAVFALASPSTDLRVLETRMVEASQVQGLQLNGAPSKVVIASIGYGINLLGALRVEGRLILKNGSHRAYALREAGVTHVPALIEHVGRREQIAVVGAGDIAERYDEYVTAPRPPLLKDYFDEKLRVVVRGSRRTRQVRVLVQNESLDGPA